MKSFIKFLHEEINTKVGGIAHLEHPSDRTFDGKDSAEHAISTLRGAISGKTPITRKIDDKMSFQTIRDENGKVGVKYKGVGSHYNFTPEDVDSQHGHKPYLAEPLKSVLAHAGKVLPRRSGEWQGGFLSTPEQRTISGGKISHSPNTIEYSVPTSSEEGKKLKNSKVSMAIHTELKGAERTPTPVTNTSEFRQHPDAHLMNHVVTGQERNNADPIKMQTASSHLDQAEKLMKNHTYAHLAGHEKHLRTYINSTIRNNETPSTEGYIKHLHEKHQKEIDKVKTPKAKDQKIEQRDSDISHVINNKKAFDKTFAIHHHIQSATNSLADALSTSAHGGYEHKFASTGESTNPEGFVAAGHDGNLLKIVNRKEFSAANFSRSAQLKAPKPESN